MKHFDARPFQLDEGGNMKYTIQATSIHIEQRGSGEPTIVFLHYWGRTSRTWSKVDAATYLRC
jgi:hypothetical protein